MNNIKLRVTLFIIIQKNYRTNREKNNEVNSNDFKYFHMNDNLLIQANKQTNNSIDDKIEELVFSSKTEINNTIDVSYIRKPTLGVKKLSKNKQPKQVNGFYKKPSLLSNFSMNLIRPGVSVENQSQSFRTNTSIKKADNSNL